MLSSWLTSRTSLRRHEKREGHAKWPREELKPSVCSEDGSDRGKVFQFDTNRISHLGIILKPRDDVAVGQTTGGGEEMGWPSGVGSVVC